MIGNDRSDSFSQWEFNQKQGELSKMFIDHTQSGIPICFKRKNQNKSSKC